MAEKSISQKSSDDSASRAVVSGPRAKGSGGVFAIRPGVWRVDIELPRDKVTGKRRRVSRYIEGARSVAEVELSRLRVADNEKRFQPVARRHVLSVLRWICTSMRLTPG